MAKKSSIGIGSKLSASAKVEPFTASPKSAPTVVSGPVRNSAIPKTTIGMKKEITHEQIAKRAYEISRSGTGGSEIDNWLRAERELKG